MNKEIISISGTSGCGKSYFVDKILNEFTSISEIAGITTRKKRDGEIDGKSSYYLTIDQFEKLENNNKLLLVKEIFDNKYAWYKSDLINNSKIRIINISYTSIATLKDNGLKLCSIFVRPSSEDKLKEFLSSRNAPEKEYLKRLRDYYNSEEHLINNSKDFDYIITNDYTEESTKMLFEIISQHQYDVTNDDLLIKKR